MPYVHSTSFLCFEIQIPTSNKQQHNVPSLAVTWVAKEEWIEIDSSVMILYVP